MNKEDIYLNFMLNLLVGSDLGAVDRYYHENREAIDDVKNVMLDWIHYEPQPIYRGVIMQKELTHLDPHPNFKCLSFSEDVAIATRFANPKGWQ